MCESKCNKKNIYLKFVKPQFSKNDNLSQKKLLKCYFYTFLCILVLRKK